MHILKVKDKHALGCSAAEILLKVAASHPSTLIALPTGSTPAPLYATLRGRYVAGERHDFVNTTFTHLDEYLGIAPSDKRAFSGWLAREILDPLNIPPSHRLMFNGLADPQEEAQRFEEAISSRGGLDLAVLGLGENGHLAFNEPGSPFDSRTRAVDLTTETIESNALYWGSVEAVPRQALTLGLGTIRDAKDILLLVSGDEKAEALREALTRKPTPDFPATCLQGLKNVTVIADDAAAKLLPDSLNLA